MKLIHEVAVKVGKLSALTQRFDWKYPIELEIQWQIRQLDWKFPIDLALHRAKWAIGANSIGYSPMRVPNCD
ncbi:hypothetical protein EHV15_01050 [Paenibacillus oralis]|uniref:Uncharacterized protein n=1 Tax=Paenibacillus oralis TaxID=2490856 RepID=A0A3P3TWT7_9BACL|nr:hypothetical protein [Paenibacillus oralis]RRJ61718.1 hypothetical protein EHV15_01050 [Paenibacillus oralis]